MRSTTTITNIDSKWVANCSRVRQTDEPRIDYISTQAKSLAGTRGFTHTCMQTGTNYHNIQAIVLPGILAPSV